MIFASLKNSQKSKVLYEYKQKSFKVKIIKKTLYLYLLLCTLTIQPYEFDLISIKDLLTQRPDIEYIKCSDIESFEYKPFPISRFPELQPNKGLLAETFILRIPNGQAGSYHGWIKIDNNIISEGFSPYFSLDYQVRSIKKNSFEKIKKITGKVAVLTMQLDSFYCHWIYNILGRLALLELIAYSASPCLTIVPSYPSATNLAWAFLRSASFLI